MERSVNRKPIAVLAILILLAGMLLAFVLPGETAHAAKNISYVKVKLSIGSVKSKDVTLLGNYYIEEAPSVALMRSKYTVKLESGALSLYNYLGQKVLGGQSSITFVHCIATEGKSNFAMIGSLRYRGNIKFLPNSAKTALQCINRVYMEDYIAGVVPYEMGEGAPVEAQKVQAILARTYAVNQMGSGVYDVVDTSANQVYKGYNPDNTSSIKAANDTKGLVLTCDGELVNAYYAASNGGFVDIPQHRWSSAKRLEPYEVMKLDPYDLRNPSSKAESISIPKKISGQSPLPANVEKYFKDQAIALLQTEPYAAQGFCPSLYGDVVITDVASITPVGRRKSQHDLSVSSLKRCANHPASSFNYAGCLDSCMDYTKYAVTLNVTAKAANPAAGEGAYTAKPVSITITIDATKLEVGEPYATFKKTSLSLITVEDAGTAFKLNHLRWGHGIGMSQRGAMQQAKEGRSYKDIILFYYPNTQLTKYTVKSSMPSSVKIGDGEKYIMAEGSVKSAVNVRTGPRSSFKKIGELAAGEPVQIIAQNYAQGWHEIWWNGRLGYVSADYITITKTGLMTPVANIDAAPEAPTGIKANSEKVTVAVGKTAQLSWTLSPANAKNKSVTFQASNGNATVDAYGVVTGVKAGSCTITAATVNGLKAKFNVTVTDGKKVKTIKAKKQFPVLTVGGKTTIGYTVSPSNAADKKVAFKANNGNVKVDAKGVVKAVKPGASIVTITAQDGSGVSAQVYVSVTKTKIKTKLKSMSLKRSYFTVGKGKKITIQPTFTPAKATNKCVFYVSENPAIAKVDQTGKVTGVKAGRTKIKVYAGALGKAKECTVTVAKSGSVTAVKSVKLNKTKLSLKTEKSATLKATVSPAKATNKNVEWRSSDASIVKVDQKGKVTGMRAGTAYVYARCYDNGKEARVKVTVKGSAKIKLNKSSLSLKKGKTATLKATVTPASTKNKKVTWRSSNKKIATVNSAGKVKAIRKGTAYIYAKALDSGKEVRVKISVK